MATPNLKNKTILLVTPDPVASSLVKNALEEMGAKVVVSGHNLSHDRSVAGIRTEVKQLKPSVVLFNAPNLEFDEAAAKHCANVITSLPAQTQAIVHDLFHTDSKIPARLQKVGAQVTSMVDSNVPELAISIGHLIQQASSRGQTA